MKRAAHALEAAWRPDKTLRLTCIHMKQARIITCAGVVTVVPCPAGIQGARTTSSPHDHQGRHLNGFKTDGSVIFSEPTPEAAFGAK